MVETRVKSPIGYGELIIRLLSEFINSGLGAALAIPLVPIDLASQNPPQAPPIHVTTHLVQVGIIVRDSNGLVGNFTKQDFVVLDRGKPREISVFSVESSASAPQAAQALPQNTFSDLPQANGSGASPSCC